MICRNDKAEEGGMTRQKNRTEECCAIKSKGKKMKPRGYEE